MKIGNVSRETGIGIHTIRFYEKQGLIRKPEKDLSGHRNYRPKDIELLNWIVCMKNSGMPLSRIQRYSAAFYQEENDVCLTLLTEHLAHLNEQQLNLQHYIAVTKKKITRLKTT